MSPEPGMVYRHDGRLLLYVRTEQRPGTKHPEHLFVHAKDRLLFEVWLREVPPEALLVIDTDGRNQANEQTWLRYIEEQKNATLIHLLRTACGWLPRAKADELRREYAQALTQFESPA